MMRPDAKIEKVYLYPKPVDFRTPKRSWTSLHFAEHPTTQVI